VPSCVVGSSGVRSSVRLRIVVSWYQLRASHGRCRWNGRDNFDRHGRCHWNGRDNFNWHGRRHRNGRNNLGGHGRQDGRT